MTEAQEKFYWQLWKKACVGQGWTSKAGLNSAAINAKRKAVMAELGFSSSKEINSTDGFGRIKAKFQFLAGDLNGATEDGDKNFDVRRRALWTIENFYKPCLRVYVADVDEYLRVVLRDRFKVFNGLNTIEDLSSRPRLINGEEKPSQLQMYLYTLGQRLQKFRSEAGDTIHDMKLQARVPCDCKLCGGRVPKTFHHLVTKAPSEEIPVNKDGVLVPF